MYLVATFQKSTGSNLVPTLKVRTLVSTLYGMYTDVTVPTFVVRTRKVPYELIIPTFWSTVRTNQICLYLRAQYIRLDQKHFISYVEHYKKISYQLLKDA